MQYGRQTVVRDLESEFLGHPLLKYRDLESAAEVMMMVSIASPALISLGTPVLMTVTDVGAPL